MEEVWEIIYYEQVSGSNPVRDFIQSLPLKAQAKIARSLDFLATYNIHIGPPHVKKLCGTPLWELRLLGGDNIRILYVTVLMRSFLLLHGFEKKTNKTPRKEMKLAITRLSEWKKREHI